MQKQIAELQALIAELSKTPEVKTLAAPENVKASNLPKSGKVKITWKKVEGATKYKVYRATSENGTYKLMLTTTNLKYTNTKNVVKAKNYYYKVKAVGAVENATSAYSVVDVCKIK